MREFESAYTLFCTETLNLQEKFRKSSRLQIYGVFCRIQSQTEAGMRRTHADGRARRPPLPSSIVVFKAEVCDEVLTLKVAERVFQLHQLDKDVVLGI